jgi:hypothetical protein
MRYDKREGSRARDCLTHTTSERVLPAPALRIADRGRGPVIVGEHGDAVHRPTGPDRTLARLHVVGADVAGAAHAVVPVDAHCLRRRCGRRPARGRVGAGAVGGQVVPSAAGRADRAGVRRDGGADRDCLSVRVDHRVRGRRRRPRRRRRSSSSTRRALPDGPSADTGDVGADRPADRPVRALDIGPAGRDAGAAGGVGAVEPVELGGPTVAGEGGGERDGQLQSSPGERHRAATE